jgi:hypothetical protein
MTLTEIANRLGCDKGTTTHGRHGYTEIYESAIDPECTLLEIGIDKGLSLRMWREWSEDIDLIADLQLCDQGDADSLERLADELWSVDVIIDDGSHNPNHQILTLETLWKRLQSGGKYFIEDLHYSAWFPEAERAPNRIRSFAQKMGASHSFFCHNKLAMLVKP